MFYIFILHSGENDFIPLESGETLKFSGSSSPGDTRCMVYTVIDDAIVEDDEEFTISLSVTNPNDQVGLPNTTTVLIMDNDGMYI